MSEVSGNLGKMEHYSMILEEFINNFTRYLIFLVRGSGVQKNIFLQWYYFADFAWGLVFWLGYYRQSS